MVRVHASLDDILQQLADDMTAKSGKRVTKTDVSYMIAMQNTRPPVMLKKKGKIIIGGSMVSL